MPKQSNYTAQPNYKLAGSNMLNSKELIEITGISRATLNNYVALGILPNPVIKTPAGGEGRATRLGYFDEDAVDCIKRVQEMKKQGYSMAQIADELGGKTATTAPSSSGRSSSTSAPLRTAETSPPQAGEGLLGDLSVEASVECFPGPAYMVNNNFELIWWNDKARQSFFGVDQGLPSALESRNLLQLLFSAQPATDSSSLEDLLSPHMAAAKKRLSQQSLIKLYSALGPDELNILKAIYDNVDVIGKETMTHFPAMLRGGDGSPTAFDLYICFYREGILFTYSPVLLDDNFLLDFLGKRNHVINELLRQRQPCLTNVAVMVADLQDSSRICSELPAEEYFELINSIWQHSEPLFRKYYGTYGKHAGDGMVYYFFPQPDCDYKLNAIRCSLELQHLMKQITQQWQSRKGWFSDLQLNIGINEGQEWFGSFHAGSHVEFTVLGETVNQASRLSDFARNGSVWSTKSMLNQIPSELRKKISFGISRRTQHGDTVFVGETYANLGSLLDAELATHRKFREVQMLPVTQIKDMTDLDG